MSVIAAVDALPASGLTVSALGTLDRVVPGEWSNITSFDDLVRDVVPDAPPALIAAVRVRAAALEAADPRYGRALQAFTLVDQIDVAAAGAVAASKVTSMFSSLSFLQQFTPKPDTTQALDAGLKLVAELLAFGLLNGMPTEGNAGLARFAGAIEDYARFDLMRLAAWVTFDGLVPLGPDFISKLTTTFTELAGTALSSNAVFDQLGDRIPGDTIEAKKAFIVQTIGTTGDWVNRFVSEKGLSQDGALQSLQGVLSVADGGLDYVAAALDASTNYTAHTGTQTVGRTLAKHAVDALKEETWRHWVTSL
ncbi:MAG: hypothetical protein ACI8PZ_000579 [Myxococcota bacterium]